MLKILLCLVIVVSTSIVGFSYSHRLYKRQVVLRNFVLLLQKCSTMMRYSSQELSLIFSDNFMNYHFIDSMPFYDQWLEMLKNFTTILNSDDIKVLTNFAQELGATDTTGQLKNIELYTAILESHINDANVEIEKKSRVYKMSGFCVGLTISILLI